MSNKWIPEWAGSYRILTRVNGLDILFYDCASSGTPISKLHQEFIDGVCKQIKDRPLEARMVIEHPPESERTHYHKEVKRIDCECGRSHRVYIDVYAVLRAFKVKSHIVGHAIKKLLAAGSRGSKPYAQDIAEAGQSIEAEKRSIEDWA